MPRSFFKTLTAVTLALALTLSGIATTPAHATGRGTNGAEAAALFAGLLLIYGLSQANRNGSLQGSIRPTPPHSQPPRTHPLPPQHPPRLVAPARCFVEGQSTQGYYRGYRARCMQNFAAQPRHLPAQCLRTVQTYEGQRRIYGGRCLAQNGWTRS